MAKNRPPKSGFTLLETLFAVVIMGTGLLLLSNSWTSAYSRIRKTQLTFEVASLLERKMTEIELEYRGKPLSEIPEEKTESFGEDYPQYSWTLTSQELAIPDISATMASQEGGVDPFMASLVKQLTEGLSKAVKEVTVKVTYKPPTGKGLNYSITTYFVDFDKEINFGMPSQ